MRAFVRYNSRRDPGLLAQLPPEVFESLEIIAGDLRDPSAGGESAHGMDIIFHLGALIAIPYSYVHPREVIETNIMGTLNILQGGRAAGVDRIVHTSTSEVYGTARRVPIDETHPLQGQSPYSASKIAADKIAESFYCTYDLPVVTVRPFNTYGPRQSARAVIPTIITQALAGGKIRLGNLDARRDFTYVSDTVAGFLRAGLVPGVEGRTFNLGSGQELTVRDLVEQVARIAGRPLELELDPQRLRPEKSEVMRLMSDNSQARAVLGWQPSVPLAAGLERTWQWIEAHPEFYASHGYQI